MIRMGRMAFLPQKFGCPQKEIRPFHPHLTLGRVKGKKNIQKLADKLKSLSLPQFKPITVDRIILFQSILKRTGAEYTALDEFKLTVES